MLQLRHASYALLALLLHGPAFAATIVVDNVTCELVDAIQAAERDIARGGCPAGSGADTVVLTADVTLTRAYGTEAQFGSTGLPRVNTTVTVDGAGFTIERDPDAPEFRIFRVNGLGDLRLNDVTLRNGRNHTAGGAIFNDEGTVTLIDCTVTGNWTPDSWAGGGIWNTGVLNLTRSVISDNTAGVGGGIASATINNTTITDSTVSGNQATASDGGGILMINGTLTMTNSTVSGNSSAGNGGGIRSGIEAVTVTNSTVVGNSAVVGGNIYQHWGGTLVNTIVASGGSGGNCFVLPGPLTDGGNNFADDDSCGPGFAAIVPGVDFDTSLADNGGPTPTHALLPGSVAIDVGGEECLPTDQRGITRPQDGDGDGVYRCDAGAFEYETPLMSVSVDVKPGSYPNSVNPRSRGVIPVAILGSDNFDVSDIDVSTLALGPGGASIAHRHGHLEDVNYDAIMDLVTHYRTQDTGIACGDESATLTGETQDGQTIEGSDSIVTVGCGAARWPGLWSGRERVFRSDSGEVKDLERK